MATIHSFPTELIRHTLSLAYPPGQPDSAQGLCSTALVHSSWKGPSVSVMTEVLVCVPGWSLELFIANGPCPVSCGWWSFHLCKWQKIEAALAKADRTKPIIGLNITDPSGTPCKDLFSNPSLRALPVLRLELSEENDDLPAFQPWPGHLRQLIWVGPKFPPAELLTASASSLASLDLTLPDIAPLAEAPTSASRLTALTRVRLFDKLRFKLALSSHLVHFLRLLPSLAVLALPPLTPRALEASLAGLGAARPLRELTAGLVKCELSPEFLGLFGLPRDGDDLGHWTDWGPALRRCAELPVVRGLGKWHTLARRVVEDGEGGSVEQEVGLAELARWDQTEEGWAAFRRGLERAGVELAFGTAQRR